MSNAQLLVLIAAFMLHGSITCGRVEDSSLLAGLAAITAIGAIVLWIAT